MAKSLVVTYLLWMFGGYFGLHHFYLRRDKQAFLWWCFPGGYFGFGWSRDLYRIPEYVKDANEDPGYIKKLTEKMRKYEKPPFSLVRFFGQLVMGNVFGILVMLALPGEDEIGVNLYFYSQLIAPLGTAIGIWLVGTIGRESGSIKPPLIACYSMLPFFILGHVTFLMVTFVGVVAFQWKSKEWRRKVTKQPGVAKRLLILALCGSLYGSLWGSYFYFNMRITTVDGDEIKLRDAIGNFFKSPAVQEFSKNLYALYEHSLEHGFMSAFQRLIDSLDPLGEKNALRVLELDNGSTQDEIRSRYRELSKKWHPDRFMEEAEKDQAHIKFVEIQQAYEKLSQIKAKRKIRNSQPDTEEKEPEF